MMLTVQLLQELGLDIEAVADFSTTGNRCGGQGGGGWGRGSALQGAVIRGAEGLVRWLIEQGVPLDHKMSCGTTALDLAEGSNLGINLNVQPALAKIIREAMVAQELLVPDASERRHDRR